MNNMWSLRDFSTRILHKFLVIYEYFLSYESAIK